MDERGADPVLSAWDAFAASGDGRASDAAGAPGAWRDNGSFLSLHTQDPGAEMDDRFDMQMITSELSDGLGLDYVAGSFAVVGNDGTHSLNGAITTGTGAPADVLAALATFDHLPVFADYAVVPEPTAGAAVVLAATCLVRRRRPRRVGRRRPAP